MVGPAVMCRVLSKPNTGQVQVAGRCTQTGPRQGSHSQATLGIVGGDRDSSSISDILY